MPGSKAVRVMVRNNIFDTNMNVQLKYDIQVPTLCPVLCCAPQ